MAERARLSRLAGGSGEGVVQFSTTVQCLGSPGSSIRAGCQPFHLASVTLRNSEPKPRKTPASSRVLYTTSSKPSPQRAVGAVASDDHAADCRHRAVRAQQSLFSFSLCSRKRSNIYSSMLDQNINVHFLPCRVFRLPHFLRKVFETLGSLALRDPRHREALFTSVTELLATDSTDSQAYCDLG
ncbi:hypothetical protein BCV70DRAFT_44536 [Testicularia cyperi]|uniref:Uncharacterized protein n=1 Tax=Testicularia cyperi TaxID=1882483 RepID=A0A317XIP9_9BASI|nr:hypothetical protein BCV70DRAFT_44536 [Testicularia cyperi]